MNNEKAFQFLDDWYEEHTKKVDYEETRTMYQAMIDNAKMFIQKGASIDNLEYMMRMGKDAYKDKCKSKFGEAKECSAKTFPGGCQLAIKALRHQMKNHGKTVEREKKTEVSPALLKRFVSLFCK